MIADALTVPAEVGEIGGDVAGDPPRRVGGAIIDPVDRIDSYDVALIVDVPTDGGTWRAHDPTGDWIADRMRLTKLPVAWFVRPARRPVHDRRMRGMVRVWSTAGADRHAIDRLRRGAPDAGRRGGAD